MHIFKILSIFIITFFSFASESMDVPPDFVHCKLGLTSEQAIIGQYADEAGKVKLRTDLKDFVELRLADGFLTSAGIVTKSDMETQIHTAIGIILGTDIGVDLFKTLVTKLTLKRAAIVYMLKALQRYKQNILGNHFLAAAGTLYRITKHLIPGATGTIANVNQGINYFSSTDNFKAMITHMFMQNDWETQSDALVRATLPNKNIGDITDEDRVLVEALDIKNLQPIVQPYLIFDTFIQFLKLYLNATKIRITNENRADSHCFYVSPTEGTLIINIHFSEFINHPSQIYALPTHPFAQHATATVTRTFNSILPTPPLLLAQQVVVHHTTLETRSISDLDDLLFHELDHCLHTVENRNVKRQGNVDFKFKKQIDIPPLTLLQTDLTEELTRDWLKPEEFRNGTGIVLMTDGTYQKDIICTYVYDKQRNRSIRWPYRKSGANTTAIDFAEYIRRVHS